jgi:predicted amidohydrolase
VIGAAVQMTSTPDVEANLGAAEHLVREAAGRGAELVVLPENFSHMGPEEEKAALAEALDGSGPILSRMQRLARETRAHLVLGGMAEKSDEPARVYNACVLVGPDGAVRAVYRKIHLFDVDIPGGVTVSESRTFKPGAEVVVADVPFGRLGLSVCYDLRFPELYREMSRRGAVAMVVPAAFTLYTGKDHWMPLLAARAIENQCYVLAAGQFGVHFGSRQSYGKSAILDPWGTVVAQASDGEGIALARLDRSVLDRVRSGLPALSHRRL